MDTIEITGTRCGTPRMQSSAEVNAGTSTGRGIVYSCVYVHQTPEGELSEAPFSLPAALTEYWELVRLSQRVLWRVIIDPVFAHGSAPLFTPVAALDDDTETPIGDVDMLGRVKHALSLNTSELADVLNVRRPTVYAWMRGGPIRSGNRERLTAVYRIAQKWWKRSRQPLGQSLQLKDADGRSLFDLLKANPINETKLESYFKVAANRIERSAQEKGKRAESYSDLAKRHGFAPVPTGARNRTLREFSRRGKKDR